MVWVVSLGPSGLDSGRDPPMIVGIVISKEV